MQLVVGLGNPGERYAGTRHNIGAEVVECAADRWAIRLKPDGTAKLGRGRIAGQEVALAVPFSWMNESGRPVAALLVQLGIAASQLVVVHDDLDLELGRIRIRPRGGAGGHNGVLSIITALQTDQFGRVKFGIGRPAPGLDPAEFVLSPFLSDERSQVEAAMSRAVESLECLVVEGIPTAMNRYNLRHPIE